MAILEKEIEITLENRNITHYENLGYDIPKVERYYGRSKKARFVFLKNTKIKVKVEDLSQGSNVKLRKTCDACGIECVPMDYNTICSRRKAGDGKDYCQPCGTKRIQLILALNVPFEDSLSYNYPEIAKELHPTKNCGLTGNNIFINSNKKLWWKCPSNKDHDYEMVVAGRTRPNPRNCPYCAGRKVNHTNSLQSIFPEIAAELHPTRNKKSSAEMVFGSHIKCWWKCSDCNHEWKTGVKDRTGKNKTGCPSCVKSKGEQRINEYLLSKNIKFKREYEYIDLISIKGNPLRFDFAVFNEDWSLNSLVEYDGEFHFKKIYKEHDLENQILHDRMKNKYCADNNVNLLRIKYTEFDNIEKILESVLQCA